MAVFLYGAGFILKVGSGPIIRDRK